MVSTPSEPSTHLIGVVIVTMTVDRHMGKRPPVMASPAAVTAPGQFVITAAWWYNKLQVSVDNAL